MNLVAPAVGKGCLAGLGLALVFFAISGLTYLALTQTGLPRNIVLLLTIGSGPVLGTAGVLAIAWMRASQQAKAAQKNETTQRDAP